MDTQTKHRRNDLDWLRVLAILVVFVYHSTRFFNPEDWHVKNPVTYWQADLLENFLEIWMMPLMFAISGASLFFAMHKGGAGHFFKYKALRLLVPLLVGVFTHASLQVYLERRTHGQFSGSYFDFLPHYFDGFYMDVGESGNFAWQGLHLWYLLILFLFCLVLYPLLRWLKTGGCVPLDRLGNFLARPAALYLLALPTIVLLEAIDDTPIQEVGAGGWPLIVYISFVLVGFVIVSHERLQASILRMRWPSLGLGVALVALLLFLETAGDRPLFALLRDELDDTLAGFNAWFWILAILGFGMRHMTSRTPFLKYANEAVLPFYILHQTVLLGVGYFVVQWALPGLLKWLVIASLSLAIIMGLYETLVRRNNSMRFLFGMRALPEAAAAPAQEPVLAGK